MVWAAVRGWKSINKMGHFLAHWTQRLHTTKCCSIFFGCSSNAENNTHWDYFTVERIQGVLLCSNSSSCCYTSWYKVLGAVSTLPNHCNHDQWSLQPMEEVRKWLGIMQTFFSLWILNIFLYIERERNKNMELQQGARIGWGRDFKVSYVLFQKAYVLFNVTFK